MSSAYGPVIGAQSVDVFQLEIEFFKLRGGIEPGLLIDPSSVLLFGDRPFAECLWSWLWMIADQHAFQHMPSGIPVYLPTVEVLSIEKRLRFLGLSHTGSAR